jgi:DNA-binding NarL/FixJ family response regulator
MTAVHLCDDLIFTSRVTGTGRDLGVAVATARTPAALLQAVGRDRPGCVILDLALAAADLPALLAGLGEPRPFVVAYGSHVDTATLKAARTAGCDVVLPRSKFVEELPTALTAWAGGRGA